MSILRIINLPTTTAIAYGLNKKVIGDRNVLTFDLGGRTFDAVISRPRPLLVIPIYAGVQAHISSNTRAVHRLCTTCEHAKHTLRTLASATQTSIEIDMSTFTPPSPILASRSFAKTSSAAPSSPSRKSSATPRLTREQRAQNRPRWWLHSYPPYCKLVSDFFNDKEPNKSINLNKAVAYGAAVHATILSGDTSEKTQNLLLLDIAPLSLSIEAFKLPLLVDGLCHPARNQEQESYWGCFS